MTREECYGRSLADLYGLRIEPYLFYDGMTFSWKAYTPKLGSLVFFYTFRTWDELLFGSDENRSLNAFVNSLNIEFNELFHANILDFKSLDELDILLTLAGKNAHSVI